MDRVLSRSLGLGPSARNWSVSSSGLTGHGAPAVPLGELPSAQALATQHIPLHPLPASPYFREETIKHTNLSESQR